MVKPFITIEDQYGFFTEFPNWAPIFDDDAVIIGVAYEGIPFLVDPIALSPFNKYFSAA